MSPSSSAARTCAFGPPADHLLLDLVVPDGDAPASGRPVVVWLHGGGWRLQDRTACPDLSRHFAARGLAMVSIDYGLAPTHRHPVQVIDLRRALRFLRANASELSLDPGRIGLWGSSAGGHVASMAALLGRQPALPGELATADDLSWPVDVACVVEGYGPSLRPPRGDSPHRRRTCWVGLRPRWRTTNVCSPGPGTRARSNRMPTAPHPSWSCTG